MAAKKASRKKAKKSARRPAHKRNLGAEVRDVKEAVERLNDWVRQAEGHLARGAKAPAKLCLCTTKLGTQRHDVSVLTCNPPN